MESEILNEPINLLRCDINRDRELILSDRKLEMMLALIWSTQIKHESTLPIDERKFTSKLVRYAQNSDVYLETRCLKFMDTHAAHGVMTFPQDRKGKLLPDDFSQSGAKKNTKVNTRRASSISHPVRRTAFVPCTIAKGNTSNDNANEDGNIFPYLLTTDDCKIIRCSLKKTTVWMFETLVQLFVQKQLRGFCG